MVPEYIVDKHALLERLRRAEGQVRGLQRQVDEDATCIGIWTQVAAVTVGWRPWRSCWWTNTCITA